MTEGERKIIFPPKANATHGTSGDQKNVLNPYTSFKQELLKFFLSQIRVANIFFVFIAVLDLSGQNITGNNWSTVAPLGAVLLFQFFITFWVWIKDRRRYRKYSDRSEDFKVAQIPKKGETPQFKNDKTLVQLEPGDLISLEPIGNKKVWLMYKHIPKLPRSMFQPMLSCLAWPAPATSTAGSKASSLPAVAAPSPWQT